MVIFHALLTFPLRLLFIIVLLITIRNLMFPILIFLVITILRFFLLLCPSYYYFCASSDDHIAITSACGMRGFLCVSLFYARTQVSSQTEHTAR